MWTDKEDCIAYIYFKDMHSAYINLNYFLLQTDICIAITLKQYFIYTYSSFH